MEGPLQRRRVAVDTRASAEIGAIVAVNRAVAEAVRAASNAGSLPVVLSRDCNSALGTLAGIGNAEIGVVWFDAHGDYNTPESSPSGFFDGMTLSVAVGDCHREVWARTGGRTFLSPARILLAATRDLDPLEKPRVERSEVQVAGAGGWDTFEAKLETLASRAAELYLHVDLDAIDPVEAPGVGFPAPGGFTEAQIAEAIAQIGRRFRIRAAAFTNYDAARDTGGKTAALTGRLLETVLLASA
ncbi:MAG: arginase family protein [Bryobacteraceae bacterium]